MALKLLELTQFASWSQIFNEFMYIYLTFQFVPLVQTCGDRPDRGPRDGAFPTPPCGGYSREGGKSRGGGAACSPTAEG